MATILQELYALACQGYSYGFRPERGSQEPLDGLNVGGHPAEAIELDSGCQHSELFDRMSHEWTVKCVEHRGADARIVRLIQKWLKGDVSEDGEWSRTTVGTPQGALISPSLANVYLHAAFDLWLCAWRKKVADHLVVGFEYRPGDSWRNFGSAWLDRVCQMGAGTPAPTGRRGAGELRVPGIQA